MVKTVVPANALKDLQLATYKIVTIGVNFSHIWVLKIIRAKLTTASLFLACPVEFRLPEDCKTQYCKISNFFLEYINITRQPASLQWYMCFNIHTHYLYWTSLFFFYLLMDLTILLFFLNCLLPFLRIYIASICTCMNMSIKRDTKPYIVCLHILRLISCIAVYIKSVLVLHISCFFASYMSYLAQDSNTFSIVDQGECRSICQTALVVRCCW